MSRHQNQVAYKEENAIHPCDGGSSAQLFTGLDGIGNGERKPLPSKPKKRIPPKKKKKFVRTISGKNKKSPVDQENIINV